MTLSSLLSIFVPLFPDLVSRNIIDEQSTVDSVWHRVRVTQCQLVCLHLFSLAEHLNPGFHTVAQWSTLAGMALCPDQGLWSRSHFLGAPADGWSLHRFTSIYLYLHMGLHLHLRLWPPAGLLMSRTNPMGLDGPMDSRLLLLALSRCGRGWQSCWPGSWPSMPHRHPSQGDTFLPGTPRRITTTQFKTISMGSREGQMR